MNRKTTLTIIAALFSVYLLILAGETAVFLPRQGVGAAAAEAEREELMTGGDDGSGTRELLPSEKININTAGSEELQKLKGIGPVLAERIIEYRSANGSFTSIEEIMEVDGIGKGRYADIANNITVEEIDHENSGS